MYFRAVYVFPLNRILFSFQSEERDKMEKENAQTLADEIDKLKMETEQEKAELQVCNCKFKSCSSILTSNRW